MRRRVYGEELASEPSQFLNEMPLELIEDLSYGSSWLSFARSSTTQENKRAIAALRGEAPAAPSKPKSTYTGKTYNSAEAVAEFFNKRGLGSKAPETDTPGASEPATPSAYDRLKAASSSAKPSVKKPAPAAPSGALVPGSHVRHQKYGKGLVLRREGSGDNVKLTVSFPGFGQKKLIEKYANLEVV